MSAFRYKRVKGSLNELNHVRITEEEKIKLHSRLLTIAQIERRAYWITTTGILVIFSAGAIFGTATSLSVLAQGIVGGGMGFLFSRIAPNITTRKLKNRNNIINNMLVFGLRSREGDGVLKRVPNKEWLARAAAGPRPA